MLMKLYICMGICLSSRFTSVVLWPGMTHLVPRLSQNASCGWEGWCHSLSFETFPSFNYQTASSYIRVGNGAPLQYSWPGKSHGQRSLVGCSPWDRWGLDTTEWLHFHFSLACIGEGNGSPLQCSCLENPSDGGAWWAAVYGVAQSRTRLKWLSSSSSSSSSSSIYIYV